MTEDHEHDEDLEATGAPLTADDGPDAQLVELEELEAEEAAHEPAEPLEAAGPTPEEWEDRFKTIRARFNTYTRAVGKVLEEDATDLLPCPLCEGAVPGFVNGHDAGRVADETVGAVQAFIGYEAPAALLTSDLNERCTNCGGHGELDTKSLNPKFLTRVCEQCHGFGYRGPGNPMDVPGTAVAPPGEAPNGPPVIDLQAALASIQQGVKP